MTLHPDPRHLRRAEREATSEAIEEIRATERAAADAAAATAERPATERAAADAAAGVAATDVAAAQLSRGPGGPAPGSVPSADRPTPSADRPTAPPARPAGAPADRAAIRARRRWPLPRQADPDAPLLEVEGLTTHFSLGGATVHAVDDVSFRLEDGEALGIAGESGCGKTTTALSLVQLLPANAEIVGGSVRLFGIDLRTKSETALRRYRWREVSIIFQGAMNALNPVKRVGDQVAEPIELRLGLPAGEARKRARELLELVGIPGARARAYPHELSGGMRQRAMIAMALACDPAIVIGDEPTTALDVMVQAQILELLEDLREQLGLSLILITHDLSVIAETCDRVMVMYAGRVAEEGPVRTVFTAPRHPYTQMLLSAFPDVHAGRRDLGTIPGTPPDLRTPPPGCRFHPRCPVATAACRTVVPSEVTFGDAVRVACHLYPPGSPGIPRPLADAPQRPAPDAPPRPAPDALPPASSEPVG